MIKGLLFFIKFSWQHEKKYIIYRVLNQLLSALIPIAAVVMPRYIINELTGKQRLEYIALYIGILAGYIFIASSLSSWLSWTGFTHRIKISQAFNVFLHQKTTQADYADIESSRYLEMKEQAEKFLFGNWKGFSYVLDMAIEVIGKTFTLVGVIAVVASLDPAIVLLFTALVFISSYVELNVQRKQADMRLSLVLTERQTMYYGQVLEDFSYGKEIRQNSMGIWLMEREKEHWEKGYKTYKKSNALGIKSGVCNSLTSLIQQVVSYTYLVTRFLGGVITIGDFSMYVAGVAAFSTAMRSVMQNIVEVAEYRKYYDAIEEYLDIPAKMRNNKHLPLPQGGHNIEFVNVSFKYPGQCGYALKNININLPFGCKFSVVGENGAGKTTFIKLISRIYDPTEGKILLDGVDIRDIDYDAYMSLFSTVFQDYKLFALTLKDNIALSASDYTSDEKVEKVMRKAGLGEKLDSLPNGIYTLLYRNFGGEGFEPSGGEGQKIAIARALFKNAPIVILDEPTAALDPRAEYDIYRNFNELVSGKTAVYISHRMSSTRFCDEIVVFDKGEIVERGTHDELIFFNGRYAEMFDLQAKYYI